MIPEKAPLKCILFDLDNTLLNFSKASKVAFQKTSQDYGLHVDESHYQS